MRPLFWAFAVLVAASAPLLALQNPTPPGVRVVLSAAKPSFFLGENVLVDYCLENGSTAPVAISVGGDYRGASRSQRFKAMVTDARGQVLPDPDPRGGSLGGVGTSLTLAPGARWCQSLPLMRYARIDDAGIYTVRATHDLGWPKEQAPEGTVTVTLRMPNALEADTVVSSTAALPSPSGTVMGQLSKPYRDYTTLRYGVYLTPLTRLARGGTADAAAGIGAIPLPEATRVLIDLLASADRAVAAAAVQQLAMRLPDPEFDGVVGHRSPFVDGTEDTRRYLIRTGWRPEFAADVRAAAHNWLASSVVQDVVQGAFMIEAVGTADDAADLAAALGRALERTVTLPFETGVYPRPRGAMQELLRAADALAARGYLPSTADDPGQEALWLASFGRGARPAGWDLRMAGLLSHRIAYMRELALTKLPADAPAALLASAGPALQSSDMDLRIAALDLIKRARLVAYRQPVAAIVRTATDFMFMNFARNTLRDLGGTWDLLQIMAARVAEPEIGRDMLGPLVDLLEGVTGWGGGPIEANEAPALSARWTAFLDAHRAAIEAGAKISFSDPGVTPDLVPRSWTLHRRGRPDWPVR